MKNKLIRTVLGLLALTIIGCGVFFKWYAAKENNQSENHNSPTLLTAQGNENAGLVVKQRTVANDIKPIQAEKTQNDVTISECESPANPDDLLSDKYFDEKIIDLTNNTEKLINILEQSIDVDSLIAHALITGSNDIGTLTEKFKVLNNDYPNNLLVSYDLLSSCTTAESACERSIIDEGITLDSQNGAVWLLSSLYELNNNNIELATTSLLEAANAPVYEEYWGEHFSVFESALSQAGAGNDLPVQIAAMGYVASAPLPNFNVLVNFCKNTHLNRGDILEACLSMGRQLVNSKSTMLSHFIGFSLQEAVYKKQNNETQISQVSTVRKELLKTIGLSEKANNLAWQSSQRTYDWIQQIKTMGELAATEYIVDEAIKLSADPNFDPCEISW